jgi:membrane protein implicated in regulation of membrane protease activity
LLRSEETESAIGEFWFAKIGIVVLAVGIVSFEATYRILSFLVLGIALIVISVLDAKKRMKTKS